MPFAPSFGSFGDFFTIVILIKNIINALDDATGSKSEYQHLIEALSSLLEAFQEVKLICQTPNPIPEVFTISIRTLRIAEQCTDHIKEFMGHIYKYKTSLREGGSGNCLKDGIKKLKWQFEKERIMRFCGEIIRHNMSINMLLSAINCRILSQIHKNQERYSIQTKQSIDALLIQQEELAEEVAGLLLQSKRNQSTILNALCSKLDSFLNGIQIKGVLPFMCMTLGNDLQTLSQSYSRIPREFEPCFTQKPTIENTPYPNFRPSWVSLGPGQESYLVKTDNEFHEQKIVCKARESRDTRKEPSEPAQKEDIEDNPKTYNRTRLYMPGGMAMPSTKPSEQVTNYIITDSDDPSSTMPESNDNDNWDTNLDCLTAYIGSWQGAKPTYEDPSEYPRVLDIGENEIEMGGINFPDMDRIITSCENAAW